MLNREDIDLIKSRGSDPSVVEEQIRNFESGFPFLEIIEAATVQSGIIRLDEKDVSKYIQVIEEQIELGIKLLKFVPASGAASRMFKSLFEAKEKLESGISENEVSQEKAVLRFKEQLAQFAFSDELEELSGKQLNDISLQEALDLTLTDKGLNYGNLPKGLLLFHQYGEKSRTSFEEHCVEGALYAKDKDKQVQIHFTVSPEHQDAFKAHLDTIQVEYESTYNVQYAIGFSKQKPATDTIAATMKNEPFRNTDGSPLFRPGGHGALLENLNDLDADLIFIKNIDNVVPDDQKSETINYKKALAGLLLHYQKNIFKYQQILDTHHYTALDSAFYAEASNFIENILNTKPPQNQYYMEKEDLYYYLKGKYNRPIRVCGMVKNEGEPGGGPFWAKNSDGSTSLQVVESSQIDMDSKQQNILVNQATHFNPVDLICAVKNYKGEKFDLLKYRDPKTGFISYKSKDGKELKAQELPGLWNGAMADWNTLFVEVPIITFNPVKTINDLLRKEHQPE